MADSSNTTAACLHLVAFNGSMALYEAALAECQRLLRDLHRAAYVRDLITYYLTGLAGMALCCLGLVGNALSLVVLCQMRRSSTYTYLAGLAVCDALLLVCSVVLLVKDVDRPVLGVRPWPWDDGLYPYLFPYVHPAAFTFQVASVWITLAFTVDRYIMICHPFRAEQFCSVSRARRVLAALYVGALLFNLPKFFEYQTIEVTTRDNVTRVGCDLTWLGTSHVFRELYHSWLYIAFVGALPFLSLAVLNALLIHAVRMSRRRGRQMNPAERKRNDTTVMLIGVVVVFFLCQAPALVSRTLWAFVDPAHFNRLTLYSLNEIGNFTIILNSAVNILPYYFFGPRFRRHFWRLFCGCVVKPSVTSSRTLSVTALELRGRPPSRPPLPATSSNGGKMTDAFSSQSLLHLVDRKAQH